MTGWSLGLRTGSDGSLQQLAQNGKLHFQNSFVLRKVSKTSLAGSREKFLPSICRFLVRKQFGMLILVAIALLAFVAGFSMVNKDDASTDSELHFKERFENNTYHVSALLTRKVVVCGENNAGLPPPHALAMIQAKDSTAFPDPCRNFAFPPPPPGDRRRIGPRPCPVCYVPVEQAVARMPRVPSVSPGLQHLTYFHEQIPTRTESHSGSAFGGYPSLVERNASFDIKESMTVHCGFVKGCRPSDGTGFDIDAADLKEMEKFHDIIVASAIFGNYDVIQQPKNSGKIAQDNVPFYMFVDEETEASLKNSNLLDSRNRVGLWRIILVRNVPYSDARRNGKVPKLLLHRLFPNVRYSIWIDGKLQLIMDPYQILERFLWRQNATFAISRHYSRFDVFEEAEANKAAGKYDNVSIDHQIDFYKKEGLTAYSEAKLPITSDVPEGCVIIKEHIPITNLFTCLWFNEVDRFTSRDQLSFATARDKLMAKVSWNINMFLDCERRNFVIQKSIGGKPYAYVFFCDNHGIRACFRTPRLNPRDACHLPPATTYAYVAQEYHRDVLEQRAHMTVVRRHSPPALVRDKSTGRRPPKRGRGERKSNSRRRRKVGAGSRGSSTTF